MSRLIRIAAGLCCLAVCVWASASHPLGAAPALGTFLLYVIILSVAPEAWLVLVPALLPIASLAPWTGWLYVDEFDLVLLATIGTLLVVKSARRAADETTDRSRHPRIGLLVLLIAFLTLSYGIALWRGLLPLPPLDANAFANYQSRYNALRIFKGFAAGLAILPFLVASLRQNETRSLRLLGLGLASGLALACVAGLWERLTFVGLMDFASDYRIAGSFWEMHTGGAAIDGMLTLAAPFAIWALATARRKWHSAAAIALLLLTGYVVLVTFTRTTYLAVGGGLTLALLLRWRASRIAWPVWTSTVVIVGALAGAICFLLVFAYVFATSGYRGLVAVAGLWFLTFLAAPTLRGTVSSEYWKAALALLFAVPVFAVVVSQVSKGPYLAYAFGGIATMLAVGVARRSHGIPWVLVASYTLLALSVLPVAVYWGGNAAALPALIGTIPAIIVTVLSLRARRPLWVVDQATLTAAVTLGIIFSAFAVASGSYYMSTRFGQSNEDFSGRLKHWERSLASLQSSRDWVAGLGLGRFPDLYFWSNAASEQSGTHRFAEDADNRYLELSGPRYAAGYGEVYRFSQRVSVGPDEPLVVVVDVRASQNAGLTLEVCEKHLLYWGTCRPAYNVAVSPTEGHWKQLRVPLRGKLGIPPWYAPRLQFFIITNNSLRSVVDVDNVRLIGAGGIDHLHNGDFTDGMHHWFFTSDHHHLPWHIKNLWLNFLFDQGWLGLLAFTTLLGTALFRVTVGGAKYHPFAPYVAGSLVGFCVAGLFDTLVDVTRIAFLFYLIAFVAILLPDSMPKGFRRPEPLQEA